MLKKGKKHLIVLLILTISAFIVLFPYIFNYKEFVFSADMQLQYRYFYEEWNRMIDQFLTNGTFPFYSLSTFLGNNFLAAKTYYLTGDVFIFLVRCFSDINKGLLAETFVIIVLSGFFMSLFLRSFGIKEEKVVITVSLLYAFSGLASMYVGQYMFHRFYAFLPLLMLGVELYREKGKLSLFALATCLCFMQSYYFMFPTCIFLVIYYFFTNHFHENRTKVLDILLSALPLIGSFIVGFLMSAVLLIPCILYVLDNPRLGSGTLSLIYPFKVIIGYIWSYCCAPFNLYSIIPYLFEQGEGGHLTWYSIYAGIVCVPFIFSLFFSFRKDKQHKSLFVTWLILTVSALIPAVSSIFHGLSEPSFRWIFLVVFYQLIITAVLLERLDSEREYLLKGLITYLALFVISFVVGFASKVINPNYTAHILFALCSIGVLILYFLLLNKNKKTFICIVSSVEAIALCFIHLFILNFPYTYSPESLNSDYMRYGEQINGDGWYRLYVNPSYLSPFSVMNLNQSLHYDYNSTVTYDSTYEYGLGEFLNYNRITWHIIDINDPELWRMLGVKYVYVTDDSELPTDYHWTYMYNVNHFMVYRLEEYRPIGFTYSNFRKLSDLRLHKDKSIKGKFLWNDILIIPEEMEAVTEDIEKTDSVNFELEAVFNDNHLYGHIYTEDKQALFLSIPYSSGWKVMDNDTYLETYKVQGGFLGVVLEPGDHYLTIIFTEPGFKVGTIGTIVGAGLWVVLAALDVFWKRVR